MVDIYICEDNQKQLNLFTKYILDIIMIEELDMQIVQSVSDPNIILEKILTAQNTGVFFLDIDLKTDINGLDLAKRIRRVQPRCYIIFITSHLEMSFLTFQYKVEALDFIIKDTTEHIKTKIHECLLNVHEKYSSLNNNITKTFLVHYADKCMAIEYDDIFFFETSYNIHKIILHANKKTIEFSGQLKDIERQLDNRFYRCHRSYIINKENVKAVDYSNLTVYMKNGEICPVSIRQKKGLKNNFSDKEHFLK